MSKGEWAGIHIHKGGFFHYRALGDVLQVRDALTGKEVSDPKILNFIRQVMPFSESLRKKEEGAGAEGRDRT